MFKKSDPIPVPNNPTHHLDTEEDIIVCFPETHTVKVLGPYDSLTPISTPPTDLNIQRTMALLPSQHTPSVNSVPSPFNQVPISPVMCHCGWIPQQRGPTGIHCGAFISRQQTKFVSDLMKSVLTMSQVDSSPLDQNPSTTVTGSFTDHNLPPSGSLDVILSI
jgi:hypothetical protein